MSDTKEKSGMENGDGFINSDQELTADELVASLCRQISGLDEEEVPVPETEEKTITVDIPENQPEEELAVKIDIPAMEEEEIAEDGAEIIIPGLNIEEDTAVEPVVRPEDTTPVVEIERADETPVEAAEPEVEATVAEAAEEAEIVIPVEPTPQKEGHGVVSIEAALAEIDEDDSKLKEESSSKTTGEPEAFDEPDLEVTDVSAGVPGAIDTPTEELPQVTQAAVSSAAISEKAQKKADKLQQKEEKKRLKQEAAEARLREKQEAKEQKKQAKEEKKANKKKGAGRIILSILMLLVLSAAVVYLALSNRYRTVFYDGTLINGADCTGLTVEEAETIVSRQMENYDLTLNFRDGKKRVISGESIGFEYVSDGSVQEIMDSQIPVMWLSAYFNEFSYDATAASSFDAAKLDQILLGLNECNITNMTPPQNAYVEFSETSKKFEIVPEQQGDTFDLSAFVEAVAAKIKEGAREIDVEELELYQKPEITSDDPDLAKRRDELDDIASACISYELPTGEVQVLDGSTLVNWLEHDEQGNLYLDSEKWGECIANYVSELAAKVNTSDSQLAFNTASGGTVVLDNYLQGWLIDLEAEGAQLTEELANRAVVTREPIYAQRAYANSNNGIGDTYVEVDLSLQYLWCYQDGAVVIESPIVSGMMVASRYTPEGIYPLNGKQAGRWLRGDMDENGEYGYESWVDYWMPFNGGIGLHDASWRADFGGSIYVGGGSHGCVNLPSNKAAAIFDWISTGTPVICYYSYGYTVSPDGTYGEQ